MDCEADFQDKLLSAMSVEFGGHQDNYDSARANLAAAKANLLTSELKLSYTKIYATVNGEVTNFDISEGALTENARIVP